VVGFSRLFQKAVPVNLRESEVEIVTTYKYLGVYLNNKISWSDNMIYVYKKGQSHIDLIRGLRSFEVCQVLLKTLLLLKTLKTL